MAPAIDVQAVFDMSFPLVKEVLNGASVAQKLKDLVTPAVAVAWFPPIARLPEGDQLPAATILLLCDPAVRKAVDSRTKAERYLAEVRIHLSTIRSAVPYALQVDHTVAYGIGAGTQSTTLAELQASRGMITEECREIVFETMRNAIEAVNGGLLRPLDAALRRTGHDGLSHRRELYLYKVWLWLVSANVIHMMVGGEEEYLEFYGSAEGIGLRRTEKHNDKLFQEFFNPVLPGNRRAFQVLRGRGLLKGPRDIELHLGEGKQLMVRAMNEAESELQVMNGMNGGPKCSLKPYEWARFGPCAGVLQFESYTCECGTGDCKSRHSILGWLKWLDEKRKPLADFVSTAVVGSDVRGAAGVPPAAFRTSMYYAALAAGE